MKSWFCKASTFVNSLISWKLHQDQFYLPVQKLQPFIYSSCLCFCILLLEHEQSLIWPFKGVSGCPGCPSVQCGPKRGNKACSILPEERGEEKTLTLHLTASLVIYSINQVSCSTPQRLRRSQFCPWMSPKDYFEIAHAWRLRADRSNYLTVCINITLITLKSEWPHKNPGDSGLTNPSAQEMGKKTTLAFDSCKQKQWLQRGLV